LIKGLGQRMKFAVEYAEKGFEALVLKQKSKIEGGDLGDIKTADIEMIKDMYESFGAKTPETDEAYNLILATFPE